MLSKLVLVISLLIAPAMLSAKKPPADEYEARGDGIVIRIAGTKCTNKKVLDQLDPQHHKNFRKAEIKLVDKKAIGACWIVDASGVFVIGEDGNQGYVPLEQFKPVETI